MTSWKKELKDLISERVKPGQSFYISELYDAVPDLGEKHQSNNNLRPKIRQTVQFLRDEGFLEVVGPGLYRRLAK